MMTGLRITPNGEPDAYTQDRVSKYNKVACKLQSWGIYPYIYKLVAHLLKMVLNPPIIEVVVKTYFALLHCETKITTFDATFDWLQASLSRVE